MSFAAEGLNAAVDGVTTLGTHLLPCTDDPGTDGSNIDDDVTAEAASWASSSGGSASSTQVTWEIPEAELGEPRIYTHFAVVTEPDGGDFTYVCGGELDQSEQFSDNGGELRFTGTITAEPA